MANEIRLPSALTLREQIRQDHIETAKRKIVETLGNKPLKSFPVDLFPLEKEEVEVLEKWAKQDGWLLTYETGKEQKLDYSDAELYTVDYSRVNLRMEQQ